MIKSIAGHAGRFAVIALAGAFLAGCSTPPRHDPEFAATFPAAHDSPQPAQAATGAIFQIGYETRLFEDTRAHHVGDILTIQLSEANNAQKSANNAISKKDNAKIDNPTILGASPEFALPGVLPLAAAAGAKNSLASSISSANDFAGKADAKQSNSLTGSITVTVSDVLPNGNLMVRGERRINLNDGNEYIKIAGMVRPIDIAADNSVLSTKIADATIIYSGDGASADSNRAGWLQSYFLRAVMPF